MRYVTVQFQCDLLSDMLSSVIHTLPAPPCVLAAVRGSYFLAVLMSGAAWPLEFGTTTVHLAKLIGSVEVILGRLQALPQWRPSWFADNSGGGPALRSPSSISGAAESGESSSLRPRLSSASATANALLRARGGGPAQRGSSSQNGGRKTQLLCCSHSIVTASRRRQSAGAGQPNNGWWRRGLHLSQL
jgi:hypothetical protein